MKIGLIEMKITLNCFDFENSANGQKEYEAGEYFGFSMLNISEIAHETQFHEFLLCIYILV